MMCKSTILVRNRYGYVQRIPCGQCIACRLNKVRQLVGRCLLETKDHKYALFVTLTYDEENLPEDGSLCPRHVDSFFKSLRKKGYVFRYLYCGEYGDTTLRPHYHCLLWFDSDIEQDLIERLWKRGFVTVGTVTSESIRYVCGYVEKKAFKSTEFYYDRGLLPEFRRFSRRPGIGVSAWRSMCLLQVLSWKRSFCKFELELPRIIVDNKEWPVDRHLKQIFCEIAGDDYKEKSPLQFVAEDIVAARKEGIVLHQLKLEESGRRIASKYNIINQKRSKI